MHIADCMSRNPQPGEDETQEPAAMCVPRYEVLFMDLNSGDSGNAPCGEGFEIGGQVCLARTPMLTMVQYHAISENEQRGEAVELQQRERD